MSSVAKPQALIWGAGKIGRGFLAEIFQSAGYQISFFERSEELVDKLRKVRRYTIHKFQGRNERYKEVQITNFEIYSSWEQKTVTQKILKDNTIVAIAVHQVALPEVIKALALGVAVKAQKSPATTMDIILCVNMAHPASYCRQLFEHFLPDEFHAYLHKNIGLIESVVMRVSPEATREILQADPLAILTNGYPYMPVDRKAFKGAAPITDMLYLSNHIEAEETRKMYTLNMAHAFLAYLGTLEGYKYSADCIQNIGIKKSVINALNESGFGLTKEFGFSQKEMDKWNEEIICSLENPALRDRLDRLGTDNKRKLGRQDRLTGPALLCLKHGATPRYLALGIARGFQFDQPSDPGSVEIQDYVKMNGIEKAIKKYCGLKEGLKEKELNSLIQQTYLMDTHHRV